MPEPCTHPPGELLTLANSGHLAPVPWRALTLAGHRADGEVLLASRASCRGCGEDVVRVATWRPGTRPVWATPWAVLALDPPAAVTTGEVADA